MKKPLPEFKDNKEFVEFVDNNDMSEYDWEDVPEFKIQRPVKRPVTLRLYPYVIDGIKKVAQENGIPYQTLISQWLSERLFQEKLLELHKVK